MKTAWFLACSLALTGCASLKPDYVGAAYVHQSHPMAGPGPAPFGGPSDETTLDGIAGIAGYERGALFGEAAVGYTLRERNMEGGPWFAEFRVGVKVRLP